MAKARSSKVAKTSSRRVKDSKKKKRSVTLSPSILTRFAHPFFDQGEPTFNSAAANAAGGRMREYVKQFLHRVPKPTRNPRVDLSEILSHQDVDEIAESGKIIVQCGGDTGLKEAAAGETTMQELVADAMSAHFDVKSHTKSPAFFLHLGDVIYGPSKRFDGYREQFYVPYKRYPGKIIAIPGNHDGDWYPSEGPLEAWIENFCASAPSEGQLRSAIFRQMPNLPGVYWLLNAPFVQFIGLYSNKLENPGYISGEKVGNHQRKWFVETLKELKEKRKSERKALVIATHHPPFSCGGHGSSTEMLEEIDEACNEAGIWPDLFLSAHAHSYQRFTRRIKIGNGNREIPYLVIGCSGHGGQKVGKFKDGPKGVTLEVTHRGWGYGSMEFSTNSIVMEFRSVDETGSEETKDSFVVDLAKHKVKLRVPD